MIKHPQTVEQYAKQVMETTPKPAPIHFRGVPHDRMLDAVKTIPHRSIRRGWIVTMSGEPGEDGAWDVVVDFVAGVTHNGFQPMFEPITVAEIEQTMGGHRVQ